MNVQVRKELVLWGNIELAISSTAMVVTASSTSSGEVPAVVPAMCGSPIAAVPPFQWGTTENSQRKNKWSTPS